MQKMFTDALQDGRGPTQGRRLQRVQFTKTRIELNAWKFPAKSKFSRGLPTLTG